MNPLGLLVRLPGALAGTVRRNGPTRVWRFGRTMLGRYGLRQTIGYMLATPEDRRARLASLERPSADRRPSRRTPSDDRPGGLDAAFTMSARRWRERLDALAEAERRLALKLPPTAAGAHVRLLIDGEDREAAATTAQAFEGASAWSGDASAVDAMLAEAGENDWIVALKAGDRPAPEMSAAVAAAAVREAPVDVLTFDMAADRPGAEGGRVLPILQPGANRWLAAHVDAAFGRYAFRAGAVRPRRGGYAGLREWLGARTFAEARDGWRHIARPLASITLADDEIRAARGAGRPAAETDLTRDRSAPERVSIVICTHERGHLLRQLVRSLDLADPRIADLVVLANNTRGQAALETLAWIGSLPKARVLVRDEPFNFSRLSNAGAAATSGERLLFLNDDITPVSDDWLEPLLAPLRDPAVGVAGPLLLYPDERVQHAGIYLGYREAAGHTLRYARPPEEDYLFTASAPREVSAVTGAVMMVRRDVFEALGGFDELLATYLQDVDLCLRAGAVGFSTIFTPFSILLHMESVSMLADDGDTSALSDQRMRERRHFLARWPVETLRRDPFHNPAFDLEDETLLTLAAPA